MDTQKVALVTGAAYGIGSAIAVELARAGFDVVVSAEVDPGDTAAAVEAAGRTAWSLVADLAPSGAGAALVDEAVSVAGRVDVLVNNAGITLDRPLAETSEDDFDLIIGVNLRAMWSATKQVVPVMERLGGGSIVNTSSVHAGSTMPNHSVYAATKGAIVAMTKALALELGPKDIRVNAVLPGAVEVPRYHAAGYDPSVLVAQIPVGRVGRPEDIAHAVAYLVDDRASFVTGTALVVDGGTLARMALRMS